MTTTMTTTTTRPRRCCSFVTIVSTTIWFMALWTLYYNAKYLHATESSVQLRGQTGPTARVSDPSVSITTATLSTLNDSSLSISSLLSFNSTSTAYEVEKQMESFLSSAISPFTTNSSTTDAITTTTTTNTASRLENAPMDHSRQGDFKKESKTRVWSDGLLRCSAGLSDKSIMTELVYWEFHPSDHKHLNPIQHNPLESFLTFEPPSSSGFSSHRRMLESAVVLAYATGRTLVLPPRWTTTNNKKKVILGLEDFFDLRSFLNQHYNGLNIMTMEEMLTQVAMNGRLISSTTDQPRIPLTTKWDAISNVKELYGYLRDVGHTPTTWDFEHCFLGLGYNETTLESMLHDIWKGQDGRAPPQPIDFQGKPTLTNVPPVERMREFAATRRRLCGSLLMPSTLLHLSGDSLSKTPFYSMVFFQDWQQDLFAKRLMRDAVRYQDAIVCAAARVLDWLRTSVGTYHAMHLRGTAYEESHADVAVDPEWILREVQGLFPPNATIYVATDEPQTRTFLGPFRAKFQLLLASDLHSILGSSFLPQLEMVEQFICARANVFVGTYHSGFSGYVTRMRGYYADSDDGGGLPNTYYHSPARAKKELRIYQAMRPPFTAREFPTAWHNINHGVTDEQ